MEVQDPVKKRKCVGLSWSVLRVLTLIVASCADVAFLSEVLHRKNWETALALGIFGLSTYGLMAMAPWPEMSPALEENRSAQKRVQQRLPHWTLIAYGLVTGVGFNWASVFAWFSRRYAFFSPQVVGVTGLIFVLYAAIAGLVVCLTGGNWRRAILVFALAPLGVGAVFFRLLRP